MFQFNSERARYERKFVVEKLPSAQIIQSIKLLPFNFKEIYASRQVNNIYFDTRELNHYNANVIGADQRMKVRIRWYGNLTGEVNDAHLEIKLKQGLLGNKLSFPLSSFRMDQQLNVNTINEVFSNSAIPDNVISALHTELPVLINTYERRYYLSFDKHFRFTIDEQMRYYDFSSARNHLLNKAIDKDQRILELKYPAAFNDLAKEISNALPYRMTKSSKYVNGISSLNLCK